MAAEDRTAKINALLALIAEEGVGATIRLDSVTDFAWDKVYRFGNGVPIERINQAVGIDVDLSQDIKGELTSDSSLLIFTKGDAVVYQLAAGPGVDHSTLFIEGPSGKAYTPETALLVVEHYDPSGGHGSLVLRD